jgi:hypothetical protein
MNSRRRVNSTVGCLTCHASYSNPTRSSSGSRKTRRSRRRNEIFALFLRRYRSLNRHCGFDVRHQTQLVLGRSPTLVYRQFSRLYFGFAVAVLRHQTKRVAVQPPHRPRFASPSADRSRKSLRTRLAARLRIARRRTMGTSLKRRHPTNRWTRAAGACFAA